MSVNTNGFWVRCFFSGTDSAKTTPARRIIDIYTAGVSCKRREATNLLSWSIPRSVGIDQKGTKPTPIRYPLEVSEMRNTCVYVYRYIYIIYIYICDCMCIYIMYIRIYIYILSLSLSRPMISTFSHFKSHLKSRGIKRGNREHKTNSKV